MHALFVKSKKQFYYIKSYNNTFIFEVKKKVLIW